MLAWLEDEEEDEEEGNWDTIEPRLAVEKVPAVACCVAGLYRLHHVRARKAGGGEALKGPRRNQRGDFDGNVPRLHSQIADVEGCARRGRYCRARRNRRGVQDCGLGGRFFLHRLSLFCLKGYNIYL